MKKYLSIILAAITLLSALSTTTAFAQETIPERKNIVNVVPADCATNDVYFYAPEKIRDNVGVYWYEGSYNCDLEENKVNGSGYPGYRVTKTESADKNIYRADIPKDVEQVMFTDTRYPTNKLVTKSLYITEGIKQIFVENPLPPVSYYNPDYIYGDWFYYYGDGKYGPELTLAQAESKNVVYSGGEFPTESPVDINGNKDIKPVSSKKDNPIKVSVKTKSVKAKTLKKKSQSFKAITVKNAQGKVDYKLVKASVKKKLRPYISVNKKGVIKIKKWKNAKKGTYKMTVKITARGNTNYNSKVVTKTLKVRIK